MQFAFNLNSGQRQLQFPSSDNYNSLVRGHRAPDKISSCTPLQQVMTLPPLLLRLQFKPLKTGRGILVVVGGSYN